MAAPLFDAGRPEAALPIDSFLSDARLRQHDLADTRESRVYTLYADNILQREAFLRACCEALGLENNNLLVSPDDAITVRLTQCSTLTRMRVQRGWLQGEKSMLDTLHTKAVAYRRANAIMGCRFKRIHTVLTILLALASSSCAIAVTSLWFPGVVTICLSILCSVVGASANYVQAPSVETKHGQACDLWDAYLERSRQLFQTRFVNDPREEMEIMTRLFSQALAANPLLPLSLEREVLKKPAQRLSIDELSPSAERPYANTYMPPYSDVLSKHQITHLFRVRDRLDLSRRLSSQSRRRLQVIDFCIGILNTLLLVAVPSGTIVVVSHPESESMQRLRYSVSGCSSLILVIACCQFILKPGSRRQAYTTAALKASSLIQRIDMLFYGGPHCEINKLFSDIGSEADNLLRDLRARGLGHVDPDAPLDDFDALVEEHHLEGDGLWDVESTATYGGSSRAGSRRSM